jgi:hypothetical protein
MQTIYKGKMDTKNLYCKVNPKDICFIRYVFEACDGIAVVTTMDKTTDEIVIRIAPGCEDEVNDVIEGLKTEIGIITLDKSNQTIMETR